ncbi:Protein qutG [Psilocybe cubensis]|uniref:Protein qutG n=2 Tax=Psilocybe cubensis TaxID=181762 RepID=A0ACB8HF53_PSICU|nr:Protein qutG [Psilocybe cubensis]KAH9486466.1 Protein qutG [Psilocybe cubensis]
MTSPELTSADLRSILDFTVKLARKAGDIILEGSAAIQSASSESGVGEKKNSVDLVTEFDVKVEELVKKELKSQYPTFQFIGEESYAAGSRPPLTDTPTFCVDPIDGTTNFIHGFPFVCISLGLIYRRQPILGVIYNPFLDHLYTGISGQGSYLTSKDSEPVRLPLSKPAKPLSSLSQALIAVEWGSDRSQTTINAKSSSFSRLAGDPAQGVADAKMAHSLRSVGSAALNFALVAQGGLDLYWEIGCWPWDVCAGIVIAQEAGAVVCGSYASFSSTSKENKFGVVTEEILTGRKYIVVRAIGDAQTEKGVETQRRIIEEFYTTVEEVEPV